MTNGGVFVFVISYDTARWTIKARRPIKGEFLQTL